jgi:ABC-type multidrug transport system ATPase subunit
LSTATAERVATGAAAVLAGVGRSFGEHVVLREVAFTVQRGERVGLHGPNGAGKSTLLRCIAGTLAPSSGRITVGGHAAGTVAARRQLGVCLAQGRGMKGRLTGEQNLLLFARVRLPGRDASREVARIARELAIEELLGVRVDRCSAGMLGQLAFARALIGAPWLFLLDEPTRSLGASARERMWEALERREHAAVLIATHREDDLERCDRRIAIGAGDGG